MRDKRTGAARKQTPKGVAVDRTGKGGMPAPRRGTSAKASDVGAAKASARTKMEQVRAAKKAEARDAKRSASRPGASAEIKGGRAKPGKRASRKPAPPAGRVGASDRVAAKRGRTTAKPAPGRATTPRPTPERARPTLGLTPGGIGLGTTPNIGISASPFPKLGNMNYGFR